MAVGRLLEVRSADGWPTAHGVATLELWTYLPHQAGMPVTALTTARDDRKMAPLPLAGRCACHLP